MPRHLLSLENAHIVVQLWYPGNNDAGLAYATRFAKDAFAQYSRTRVETRGHFAELLPPFLRPLTLTLTVEVPGTILGMIEKQVPIDVVRDGGIIEVAFDEDALPAGMGDLRYKVLLPELLGGYWQIHFQGPQADDWHVRTGKGMVMGSPRGIIENMPYGKYIPVLYADQIGQFRLQELVFRGQPEEVEIAVRVGSARIRATDRTHAGEPRQPTNPVRLTVSDEGWFTECGKDLADDSWEAEMLLVTGRYWVAASSEGAASAVAWFTVREDSTTEVNLDLLPSGTLRFPAPGDSFLYVEIVDRDRGSAQPRMRFRGESAAIWPLPIGRYDLSLQYRDVPRSISLALQPGEEVLVDLPR